MTKRPPTLTLLGVLLTTLAILTLEVALTRIFSVLMWYHFASMAISLALLGSGVAGVWLYLMSDRFPSEKSSERLALLALLFALVTTAAFLLYLRIPFELASGGALFDWGNAGWLLLIYLVLALPFLLGGAVVALALTHFSRAVGQVYFFDLVGASLGCLVSVVALTYLGGANTVLLAGVLAGLAAFCFGLSCSERPWRWATGLSLLLLAGLLASNLSQGWLQVRSRSGYDADNQILFEKWNALSRITVYEDPYWLQPFGWGLSPTYVGPDPGHHLLLIDGKAGTPLQRWETGNWEMIEFLRYDLTSLAYTVLPEANVFIIGPGGGRDILTGLLYGARQITGVELNPAIVTAARNHFGDYTGHVYDQPGVQVAVEDARTYLSRSRDAYDLIQASLIDTWAASSAGAFALSENGLYTREAFLTYYDRLSPDGLVSFSRWYFIADPTETLRLVALGVEGWQQAGVADPAAHIVVIANFTQNRSATEGLATMLLKKSPFTPEEVARLAAVSEQMEFTLLYAPGMAAANPVQALITAPNLAQAIAAYPLDISPPTDNRPFFFNFVPQTAGEAAALYQNPAYMASFDANRVLRTVLLVSALFTVLFILAPLALRRDRGRSLSLGANWPFLLYFAALGAGFMLVEIPLIQRLTIYLGSPTYALVVVLFAILLSSGSGSLSVHRVETGAIRRRLRLVLTGLIGIIALLLLLLPAVLPLTQHWLLPGRLLVTAVLLLPLGFLMGQPFPLALRWITARTEGIVPWLWAVNGATSVVGSALATLLALQIGFRVVSLSGILCYGLALVLAVRVWRGE